MVAEIYSKTLFFIKRYFFYIFVHKNTKNYCKVVQKVKSKAIFSGTFDPFTIGHADIVNRALKIFDEIIIAIGKNNEKKSCLLSVDKRIELITDIYKANNHVKVVAYDGLTADLMKKESANTLVRGVRSITDIEYERQMADVNRKCLGVETLLLFSNQDYSHVSSSIVRELLHYGQDVTSFFPNGIDINKYLIK